MPPRNNSPLYLLGPRANWANEGACNGLNPNLFYPVTEISNKKQGPSKDSDEVKEAKAVCARCPVRDECLDYALTNGIQYGIWGGKTDSERRKIRRGKKR